MDDTKIAIAIRDAVHARGAGKTICPSQVARALNDNWRPLMPDIRRVAQSMSDAGDISVTQNGTAVDAVIARGPIRLGLPHDI